ncbi:uncharacterized protein LOC132285915 [Cornus florida]|uniref:uncharacterized protein LOC132285915 n=1 Tax=Cornus florida TaxID=4283 RepID=UPI00289CD4B2|nr:uncharacterized protein LOC132285915 [Cornus florida]
MEEAKAAAYYDELTRKGEGAARFKQGLGFSSSSSTTTNDSNDVVPTRGSALPSSSSFLSSFVRASSPSSNTSQFQKQAQLQTIHNKLNNPKRNSNSKPSSENHSSRSRVSNDRARDGHKSDVERESRERSRDRHSRRRNRSRSRERHSDRRSSRDRDRHRDRDRYRERDREGKRRSSSPSGRRLEREKGASKAVDYSRLIEGYDKMSPAQRVKAKMKFQLSETAEKDATNGMGSGWERFEFNKDAPLDDEEIEAAEDDEALVKNIGRSFRFSAVEARREEEIKAAHDEAMFGASSIPLPINTTDDEVEEDNDKIVNIEVAPVTGLISDKVLGVQRGSWRDRARKL